MKIKRSSVSLAVGTASLISALVLSSMSDDVLLRVILALQIVSCVSQFLRS